MELAQSYLKGYADYISRCKLRDLVNATNDNLRQYVRAYSELMLEIWHMHELDRVCQFVMGLPTWAKQKLEESWPASLFEAITKVENFSDVGWSDKSELKRTTSSSTRSQGMKGNGTEGEEARPRISPNKSKSRGSNLKGTL